MVSEIGTKTPAGSPEGPAGVMSYLGTSGVMSYELIAPSEELEARSLTA